MNFGGSHRGKTELEKNKIIFQFTLMIIVSVVGGICFSKLLGETVLEKLTEQIINHFSSKLPSEKVLSYLTARLFKTALSDFLCIVTVFVFSFSFINYTVSDAVIVFCGFKFGINTAVIVMSKVTALGIGNSLSYILIRGIMLAVLLRFACKMAIYALDIRRFSASNARVIYNQRTILSMLVLTFSTFLISALFNLVYCIFIYIF